MVFEGEAEVKAISKVPGRKTEIIKKTVNIIDTVGFCDSIMSHAQVEELIQHWLELQKTTIDKVVVVTHGRIEKIHADSIKTMLKWLHFSEHKTSFVFVYNKADDVLRAADEATVQENLALMVEILGVDFTQVFSFEDSSTIDLVIPLGIAPGSDFDVSEKAMSPLVTALFTECDESRKRIPVSTSSCTIL
jgi:GTP-binding protein EngB required for normal cell division